MAENGKTTGGHDPSDRENSASSGVNTFANDGSFLAMFQKKMEEQKKLKEDAERRQDAGEDDTAATDPTCSGTSLPTPPPDCKLPATKKGFLLPIRTSLTSEAVDAGSHRPWSQVGKRKGPILKTGVVKKKKPSGDKDDPRKKDPWEQYMAEVQKYKAHQCCDDDKTRPLVK
ncbi:telomerase RNA component interacting RNase-like isoform X1 [Branchiostoma lanceolatum]|uniref:telomerase RNA component interacting RNase-like isoform X1 n=1 Tax=Branchiostoma lanceolatum TaxID=7740 RepID=UPI003455361D